MLGFAVILFTIIKANVAAQRLGFTWLAIGIIVVIVAYARGRRPQLAGLQDEHEEVGR